MSRAPDGGTMAAVLLSIKNFFFNPILEKDLRGTGRSLKFFLFIIGFLFIACIPLLAIASDLNLNRSGAGKELFDAMFIIQAVCIALAIPAYACTTVAAERQRRTFDLLRITALSPWEILWGKFVAIMSYILIFIFAFLPLAAICFLYGGTDPKWVAMLYFYLLLGAAASSGFCLMLSAASSKSMQTVIVGYIFMFVGSCLWFAAANEAMGLGEGRRARELPFVSLEWLLMCLIPLMLWSLFHFAATSLLKPPSWNKSTSLRVWVAVYMLICVALMFLFHDDPGDEDELAGFLIFAVGIPSVFAAIGFCGEPGKLPARLIRKVKRIPILLKPFAPGWKTAIVFVLLTFLISAGAATARFLIANDRSGDREEIFVLLAGMSLFILFCCVLAVAARSLWNSPRSRIISVSVLAALILFPMLGLLEYDRHSTSAGIVWISPPLALLSLEEHNLRVESGPAFFFAFYTIATLAACRVAWYGARRRRRTARASARAPRAPA